MLGRFGMDSRTVTRLFNRAIGAVAIIFMLAFVGILTTGSMMSQDKARYETPPEAVTTALLICAIVALAAVPAIFALIAKYPSPDPKPSDRRRE